jgi:general stress protein 26
MNYVEGLKQDFMIAKLVNLVTYAEDGSKRSRPMTNFNEDPYKKMWFPTYSTTNKVKDIERDPRVIITFPGSMEGKFWEIEGQAGFEKDEEVSRRWRWWYLYWHPEAEANGWGQEGSASYVDHRKIIDVDPTSVRLVDASSYSSKT